MLSVFYGSNKIKSEEAYLKLVAGTAENLVVRLTIEDCLDGRLEEFARGGSLFGERRLVCVRGLLESALGRELVESLIRAMVSSPEHFAILEQDLSKEMEKILTKALAQLNKHERTKAELEREQRLAKQEANKIYAVSDAMGRRDRRALWLEYQKALRRGVVPEELYWKMVWQTRSMLQASGSSNAKEAGLHPFVYDKSKQAAKNYTRDELMQLSGDLLEMWHDIHAKGKDLELTLEQFILNV